MIIFYILYLLITSSYCTANKLYVFGDSISMNMVNFQSVFPDSYQVHNFAVGGNDIQQVKQSVSNLTITTNRQKNCTVSVMVGIKDIINSFSLVTDTQSLDNIIKDYNVLLDTLETVFTDTEMILITSVLPVDDDRFPDPFKDVVVTTISRFNSMLKLEVDKRGNFVYIDLFSTYLTPKQRLDKNLYILENSQYVHPNSLGYLVWKECVQNLFASTVSTASTASNASTASTVSTASTASSEVVYINNCTRQEIKFVTVAITTLTVLFYLL